MERILQTPVFARADRQSRFLKFVVERVLAGDDTPVKEFEIGCAVYDRPGDYDPRTDPIVRVEASRLRGRLREYYATDGLAEPIRFDLPKGSYAATISAAPEGKAPPALEAAPPSEPVKRKLRLRLSLAFALALVAILAGAWAYQNRKRSQDDAARQRAGSLTRQAEKMFQMATRVLLPGGPAPGGGSLSGRPASPPPTSPPRSLPGSRGAGLDAA